MTVPKISWRIFLGLWKGEPVDMKRIDQEFISPTLLLLQVMRRKLISPFFFLSDNAAVWSLFLFFLLLSAAEFLFYFLYSYRKWMKKKQIPTLDLLASNYWSRDRETHHFLCQVIEKKKEKIMKETDRRSTNNSALIINCGSVIISLFFSSLDFCLCFSFNFFLLYP